MPGHDIIVIGGSTGSIEALKRVSAALPADLPAAVFVVVHVGARGIDALGAILDAEGKLPAATAVEGEPIAPGRIRVAPADHHLVLQDGVVRLGRGPRENMARPAVDALFRSAAAGYGPRTIGLVLSGELDDGAAGLAAIKQCGGLALVQDPADASAPDMPEAALRACDVDYRAPARELGELLARLASEPAGPAVPVPPGLALEVGFALGRTSDSTRLGQIANPTTLPCPACGGVLSELHDRQPLRFRCQVGHAYTAECVDREQDAVVEEAFMLALRALDSRATLVERMAADAQEKGRLQSAADFASRAREYRKNAETIRTAMLRSALS